MFCLPCGDIPLLPNLIRRDPIIFVALAAGVSVFGDPGVPGGGRGGGVGAFS